MTDVHSDGEHVTVEDCAIYLDQVLSSADPEFMRKLSECETCKEVFEDYVEAVVEHNIQYFHGNHPAVLKGQKGDR